MTSQAAEGACALAWRNYLLLHNGVSENDNKRSALYRYVTNLRDIGENDFNHLQIAAVAYLRKLDELHDDQGARLAADQALAECLESRSGAMTPEQKERTAWRTRPLPQTVSRATHKVASSEPQQSV
jgi:hypothetical protein